MTDHLRDAAEMATVTDLQARAEASAAIRVALDFAYKHGLHEFGYDPLSVLEPVEAKPMTTNPTAPQDGGEKLAPREHWSRQEIVKTIINAMVEANGKVQAVPAGKAADHILAYLSTALDPTRVRNAALEEAVTAARDAMVAQEWPPQDGDVQIEQVLAAIRALQQKGPSNG